MPPRLVDVAFLRGVLISLGPVSSNNQLHNQFSFFWAFTSQTDGELALQNFGLQLNV
jgi:hypothetical protein